MTPTPRPQYRYFIAPDGDGTRTIWRHNPARPDLPTAVLTWHPVLEEVFALASRGLEERAAAQTEPAEECDACPEPVNPDARCTHGRSLCPECLTRCPECRDEFADDGRLTR